jgi:hypothetical protein
MEELASVEAVQEQGLRSCAHARPGKRQALLVDAETPAVFELAPGISRENITTEGLHVKGWRSGNGCGWAKSNWK